MRDRMSVAEAIRLAVLSCNREQLLEALGPDYAGVIVDYWYCKREDAMRDVVNRITKECPGIAPYDFQRWWSRADKVKQLWLKSRCAERELELDVTPLVGKRGVLDDGAKQRARLAAHLLFESIDDAYKYSIDDVEMFFCVMEKADIEHDDNDIYAASRLITKYRVRCTPTEMAHEYFIKYWELGDSGVEHADAALAEFRRRQ